jgi:hypothetical protein
MNVMATDTIIFSNSDLNPQNYLQGAARAHQIGRTSENHFLSSLAFLGWGPGDSTKQGVESRFAADSWSCVGWVTLLVPTYVIR